MVGALVTAEEVLACEVSDIKIVHSDHRPGAEVNELVLLVGSRFVRLRWSDANRVREWLCATYEDSEVQVPISTPAGIAKVF